MRNLFFVLAIACVTVGLLGLGHEMSQTVHGQKPPPAPVPVHPPVGGFKTLPRGELHRFDKPLATVPNHRPPDRDGGRWHWHPRHGWAWLPLNLSPGAAVLLPENYALPEQVLTYQIPVVTITCPHCGRPIECRINY